MKLDRRDARVATGDDRRHEHEDRSRRAAESLGRARFSPSKIARWRHDRDVRKHGRKQHYAHDTILEVRDLKVWFPVLRGLFRRRVADVKAVDGVSFSLRRGEVLGLVGESGCGKTTLGRAIVRLYDPTAGQIMFEGRDITRLKERQLRPLHKKMAYMFQDPYGSLNPRQCAGSIIGEPVWVHKLISSKDARRARVDDLMRIVGLDPCMAERFPHEFSGGQRQRIGIARALACEPSLIVCDEPVSALDVSIQAQIINLLEKLQEEIKGLTYIFIAHDLSVVRHISDRVAVMYLGRIVELTGSDELYERPLHPYTQALISAVPIPDRAVEKQRRLIVLQGETPSPLNPPCGCHFHPRCPYCVEKCREETPALIDVGDNHLVACHRVGELSPMDEAGQASCFASTE